MANLLRKIREEKLLTALVVVFWLFLFLTTISKTYAYFARSGKEFELGYTVLRAFLIWGILAVLAPCFIMLARKFPIDARSLKNIGLHILFSVLLVPIHAMLFRAIMMAIYSEIIWDWEYFWSALPVIMSWLAVIGPLSYWLVIGSYYLKKYYDQYRERQLRNTEMEAELASIRLHVLKVQLQPHFLFNTLHSIHTLMYEAPGKARRILALLKRFLQVSINRVDEQQVLLTDELEFTGTYLEIEKTRFSNRLTIETDIKPDTLHALVPSFLLQPLVENAVKHGIAKKMEPGILKITSVQDGQWLYLFIEDNGPGLNGKVNKEGVGLQNIRQRLNQLYENAVFELTPSSLGGLKVKVQIPFVEPNHKARPEL